MNVLMLDQTPDLPVNHPVELGDQNDIVTELSMLRKKAEPLRPAGLLPFPGIEEQLTLVDHQQDRSFLWRLVSKPLPAVLDQEFGRHLVIGAICKVSSFILAEIYREVTDHRITQTRPIRNCPGTMQALAGTWCTAVQTDHINHRSLSATA